MMLALSFSKRVSAMKSNDSILNPTKKLTFFHFSNVTL